MGLPSGLQWANCNIGAERPSELGLYFSWGNVEGHAKGSGYDFSQAEYENTPAAGISADLLLSDDAARANLGEPWRMPTAAEFLELYDNCTVVWTELNGVSGHLLTSNINGNTLFFPASGVYTGTTIRDSETTGLYWSSTYLSATSARNLRFNSSTYDPQYYSNRRYGFQVRAVFQPT